MKEAFEAVETKTAIRDWFQQFSDKPDDYNIEKEHHESMKNAAKVIGDFSGLVAPLPFFEQAGQPAAPEISYRGKSVRMRTMFDVVGWILSVVGTAPGPPGDHRTGYYQPLVTLYAVIIRTLLKKEKDGALKPQENLEPNMIQITWFYGYGSWRVALGANLDKAAVKPKGLKDRVKNDRANVMLWEGLINVDQFCEVNMQYVGYISDKIGDEYGFRPGQAFGHCAETLPFMFIKWIMADVDRDNVGGVAVKPPTLLGKLEKVSLKDVEDWMKGPEFHFNKASAPPCPNCEILVDNVFGEDALPRFLVPL